MNINIFKIINNKLNKTFYNKDKYRKNLLTRLFYAFKITSLILSLIAIALIIVALFVLMVGYLSKINLFLTFGVAAFVVGFFIVYISEWSNNYDDGQK
jgi:uncharacterized BrkB/YihY/UPF0761 family membrane protein